MAKVKFQNSKREGKPPGGGGDSHIKVTGVLVGFFESSAKRYRGSDPRINLGPLPQDKLSCGSGPKLILPLRGTKTKHNLSYS